MVSGPSVLKLKEWFLFWVQSLCGDMLHFWEVFTSKMGGWFCTAKGRSAQALAVCL